MTDWNTNTITLRVSQELLDDADFVRTAMQEAQREFIDHLQHGPRLGPPTPPLDGPTRPTSDDQYAWLRATADLTDEQWNILDEIIADAENSGFY